MEKYYAHTLTRLRLSLFVLAFCTCFFSANAQVYIAAQLQGGGNTGDSVKADVNVAGFEGIVSAQFSVNWDPNILQFSAVNVVGLPVGGSTIFNTNLTASGLLNFGWIVPNLVPLTLPECAALFTIEFVRLSGGTANVVISNDPVGIEVATLTGILEVIPNAGPCVGKGVSGKLFQDENGDCTLSSGEIALPSWHLTLTDGGVTYTTTTNGSGEYEFGVNAGDYILMVASPNPDLWEPCQTTYDLQVSDSIVVQHIGITALVDCPLLEVQLATPSLRPCFQSEYQVHYCNNGTVPAVDALASVQFDGDMTVVASDIPGSNLNGNTHNFPLGTVGVGECGSFGVTILLDCDAPVGLTHCVAAVVFPNESCFDADPQWDGSHVVVQGGCLNGQVGFTISNTGADMAAPTWYNVIQDGMMVAFQSPLQLAAGEILPLSLSPANGATYRVEAQQSAFHPGNSAPSATVEACGTNDQGTYSLGYFTQYPQDDADPYIDIDCRQSTNSYDPNDKQGFPTGFCDGFVSPDTELEYMVRFQNTGTDTAFNVVILDTLPASLSPFSLRPGASSHPYVFTLRDEGVAEFRFTGIDLPQFAVNEARSQGFVQYRIAQHPGNADGTPMGNRAAIYFDLNAPIITNTVENTVLSEQLHISSPATVTDASAQASDDGNVVVGNISGGVPPYVYALNGVVGGPSFGSLLPGAYTLEVSDESGCQVAEVVTVGFATSVGEDSGTSEAVQLQPTVVEAGGNFHLVFEKPQQTGFEVRIFDTGVKLVKHERITSPQGRIFFSVEAPKSDGVFFVEVSVPGRTSQMLLLVVQ